MSVMGQIALTPNINPNCCWVNPIVAEHTCAVTDCRFPAGYFRSVPFKELWTVLRGRDTLALPTSELTGVHERISAFRDWIDSNRGSSPFFTGFVDVIRSSRLRSPVRRKAPRLAVAALS